jgi:hypothetical protein
LLLRETETNLQHLLATHTKVVYISFIFWLLAVESRDLSQAEKEITAYKVEEVHKMTIIFTQNDNLGTL